MEVVAKFHLLDYPRGPAQGKILKDIEGMDSVPPSLPLLGCNRLRHDNPDVAGCRGGK